MSLKLANENALAAIVEIADAEKIGQVGQMVNELHYRIDLLEDTIAILANKLVPVLPAEPPEDDKKTDDNPRVTLVPLADTILSLGDRISSVNRALIAMVDKCEL